ncbi:outer membrane beta-barrel protein [Massilia sp. METH4]|uniref:outer membrane beta-barrel protein n=1 Tax=Massilia sp. METH4 TaxID=3123041 RepID=UPI0030CD3B0E
MKQVVLLAALLAAVPAFAQNMYVTGQVARVEHKLSVDDVSIKDNDTGVTAAFGYKFNPNVAVEAGYLYLGEFSQSADDYTIYAKPKSFYGAVVGTLPVTPAFSLSAKVGVARHRTKVGYIDREWDDADSTKVNKTSALFGIGAAFQVTPTVAVVAEYTRLGKVADDEYGDSVKASLFSAGVRVSF